MNPEREKRTAEERRMFERSFKVLTSGNGEEIDKAKEEFYNTFPDRKEMIETIFSFPSFLDAQARKEKVHGKERREVIKELTEYQFLITHFIDSHDGDREITKETWDRLENIAQAKKQKNVFSMFRRGVITQVASHKIFEALGSHPQFSRPRDDQYNSVDLWSDDHHAVQVKSAPVDKADIFPTDTVNPVAVQVTTKDGTKRVFDTDYQLLQTKVKTFGPDVEGFFLVLPFDQIDKDTGIPEAELVRTIGDKLKAIEKEPHAKAA